MKLVAMEKPVADQSCLPQGSKGERKGMEDEGGDRKRDNQRQGVTFKSTPPVTFLPQALFISSGGLLKSKNATGVINEVRPQ